jgi:hypothetical protein
MQENIRPFCWRTSEGQLTWTCSPRWAKLLCSIAPSILSVLRIVAEPDELHALRVRLAARRAPATIE